MTDSASQPGTESLAQARAEFVSLPPDEAVKFVWGWIEVLSEVLRLEQEARLELTGRVQNLEDHER